jgi:hypothetical protein
MGNQRGKLESSRAPMEKRERVSEHKSVLISLNKLGKQKDRCEGREEI